MYELVSIGKNTYYMDCPSKVGVYALEDKGAVIIDSGNDKDAAKKLLRHISEMGLEVRMIINTHSHADHIGGNAFIFEKTGCEIYTSLSELAFVENTVLEPSLLYGANPLPCLKNKFLMAKESKAKEISKDALPYGFEICHLPGHSLDMLAVKTPDDVWFCADAVAGQATLQKYPVSYLYDIGQYLDSLEKLSLLKGKAFVPSHCPPCEDILPLVEINRRKTLEICELVYSICKTPRAFDDILAEVFNRYGLALDHMQYALSGSTIRSYLTYLEEQARLTHCVVDNKLCWQAL